MDSRGCASGLDDFDSELENLCLTFLTMGHENVATAITWTLIMLADNPDSQQIVRTEALSSNVTRKASGEISWLLELNKLSKLEQSFLEASRFKLYPSGPVVTRVAEKEMVVGNIN